LPWQQRPATQGNLWLLGDAAGHCLPLTGEGIRFAFQDGDAAGALVARVLESDLTWETASSAYAEIVERHRQRVGTFTRFQSFVRHVPNPCFAPLAWVIARRAVRSWGLKRYMAWEHTPVSALP
jgi:flavin-dependent dehydrogenase